MRTRASLEREKWRLTQELADELRYPVSSRDRRQWFERTARRVAEIKKQLGELEEGTDDEHRH